MPIREDFSKLSDHLIIPKYEAKVFNNLSEMGKITEDDYTIENTLDRIIAGYTIIASTLINPNLCEEGLNLNFVEDNINISIDNDKMCITNYTLPGHFLYPGKIERCLKIKNCNKIYVETTGEGFHFCGNNTLGEMLSKLNVLIGKDTFEAVDNRLKERILKRLKSNITLFFVLVGSFYSLSFIKAQSIDLTNGYWVIKEIVLIDGKDKREVFYKRGASDNIMNTWSNITFVFNPDGTIGGNDIYGNESKPYGWKLLGNRLITDDGEWLNFKVLNDNEIRHTETFVPLIDNPLKFSEVTLERQTGVQIKEEPIAQKVKIYPIPVSCHEKLFVEWEENGSSEIELFDINGNRLKGTHALGSFNKDDLIMAGIPSGNYLIKVTLNNTKVIANETIQVICN